MQADYWNKSVIKFLKPYLEASKESLQVATGFFSIQGYNLIRDVLADKWVQLLVGFDELSRDRLREMLVEDIMLYLRQWSEDNRRRAVLDLVERIQKGRFQIIEQRSDEWVDARARKRDHGKVYILDKSKVLSGSVNLTLGGLRNNAENLTLVDDPARVSYYLNQFNKYWEAKDTLDITKELLDALLAWLTLASPFDVYLKTILALIPEKEEKAQRDNYKMPVKYQLVVIERVLRQLNTYGGAMLVASTGLGKTVMATHVALRLQRRKQIENVIVFAPKQVHPDWRGAMRSAGIHSDIITRDLLDRPGTSRGTGMLAMEEALSQLDERYLIIIDESQYFRNRKRAKDGKRRHSFQRIVSAVKEKKPLVLLLTATPFSKEVGDLNNQLRLLPHTAEKQFIQADGQFVMPGMIDDAIAPEAWKVMDSPDFFEDFIKLTVATVISTSQVAKDFAEHTEDGDFILFGEEKRWIPKVEIAKIKVPVFMEKEISEAITQGLFLHKPKRFRDRNQQNRFSKVIVQNKVEIAWMSSPYALRAAIKDAIYNVDKVKFVKPQEQREERLLLIYKRLQSHSFKADPKLSVLRHYLRLFYDENRKVLIFTERHLSALYLVEALNKLLPFLKVACTIKASPKGSELKDFEKEVMPLIKGFAPEANKDKITPKDKLVDYNVLIVTDAYSTGVNLQDASVVINYDLAWTPDVIIQRAGRILRFWHLPRRVSFLVFTGGFQLDMTNQGRTHKVEKRLRQLKSRSKNAQKFSEIPIIPDTDTASFDSLGVLSRVKVEDIGLVEITQLEEFSGVSPFLRHITTLKKHEARAATIPDDITSARYYSGARLLMYLLLKNREEYTYLIYDVESEKIQFIKEDDLLDMIQCIPQTPIANMAADELERIAQKARIEWEKQQETKRLSQRICACLLVPQKHKLDFESLL